MTSTLTALAVMVAILGIVVAVLGFMPSESSPGRAPSRLRKRVQARRRITHKQKIALLVGFVLGVAAWAVTGWIVLIIAVPIAVYGLPLLLSKGSGEETINKLEALETWTRNLSGLTSGSLALERVLTASLASSPEGIRAELTSLTSRINARWPLDAALQAFADDLNDSTADLVAAHLKLASQMRGPGLANALTDLADTISEEVRNRRQIEADRAKPRTNTRIITLITLAVIAAVPFAGTFTSAYSTPIGQIFFALWLALYALMLLWLKRTTIGKPTPRILTSTTEKGSTR